MVVSDCVVIVAEAMAGAVTVAGLTVQTGMSTIVVVVDVTVQAKSTVPVKLSTPTVMLVEDVPPGDTALGLRGSAARVKVWAEADGKARSAAKRHKAAIPAWAVRMLNVNLNDSECDDSDFNMKRFQFN